MSASTDMTRTDAPLGGAELESFVVRGDLRSLSPDAKARHYVWVCTRLGLEAATKPFDYIVLNGKEVMYANKGCAEQLRMLHKVSINIASREESDGVFYVYAKASLPDGRVDEDCGAVSIANLKGNDLANAKMKATTKAKRRVTLSILGLGMLDESELETIPSDKFASIKTESPTIVRVAEKKSEALPELPDKVELLPASIILGIPRLRNAGIDQKPISSMSLDELELIVSACGDYYKKHEQKKGLSELGMKWLRAIIVDCEMAINSKVMPPANDAPPPTEAPSEATV